MDIALVCIVVSCVFSKACLLDDGVAVSTAVCFTDPPLIYCSGNHKKTDCALCLFPSVFVDRERWEDIQQGLHPDLQHQVVDIFSLRVRALY